MITVVKVGGSLFDLPDLGPRLHHWLRAVPSPVVLVPGGGRTADVIRFLDGQHGLGEEKSHWLALQALTLNAHFLANLLPASKVIDDIQDLKPAVGCRLPADSRWPKADSRWPILDMYAFARADDQQPDHLPHSWEVTSDSLALQAAIRLGATTLVLLKSTALPQPLDWQEASRQGCVDPYFARLVQHIPAGLQVQAVAFRKT